MSFLEKLRDFALSSTGQGISTRIKGASAFVLFVASLFKFTLGEDDISATADAIGAIVSATGAIAGALLYVTGLARYKIMKREKLGRFAS
jgi:hypothetical protein